MYWSSANTLDTGARTVETDRYKMYIPSNIPYNTTYPLVVAFDPGGNYDTQLDTWSEVSERNKWIIMASKEFRNEIDATPIVRDLAADIAELPVTYPVALDKIIAAGFSGGGMCSYLFTMDYPNLIAAVVSNGGLVNWTWEDGGDVYPDNKIVVQIAGTTDFNYETMLNTDLPALQARGWQNYWIEFSGGHSIGPAESYREAADWLDSVL